MKSFVSSDLLCVLPTSKDAILCTAQEGRISIQVPSN